VTRNDHVGAHQSTAGSGETSQERHRDGKRWISDDSEWSSWQSHVGPVSLHHRDVLLTKFPSKFVGSRWVQFKGDDARTSIDERACERTGPRADIQYEVASRDAGVINKPFGPSTVESMPSPSCPMLGHGVPS
jgi:hypothetical protein